MNTKLWYSFLLCLSTCTYSHELFLNIKVLLDNLPLHKHTTLSIKSDNGLLLATSTHPTKKYFFKHNVTFTAHDKKTFINARTNHAHVIRITPLDGKITVNNTTYVGHLYFYINKDTCEVINKVPLEDYIDAVLRTEGWPGWPLETYKVFAITCRTYVIYQLRNAQKTKKHFHIGSTNAHQTYRGFHTCQVIKDAVQQTEGIVISYKKEPILAMFDSCCGGITPSLTTHLVNFKEAPYLARPYACPYCKGLKIYSWKHDIALSSFLKNIQKVHPTLTSLNSLEEHHDKAGILKKLLLKSGKKTYTLEGKKVYSLFPSVNSFAFSITKKRNRVILEGTGYGHHIGLCQWGANELVKKGWSHKKIIRFYYPGTTLLKLKRKIEEKLDEL